MNNMVMPPDNRTVNPRLQSDNGPIHEGKALLNFLNALNNNLESIHHKLAQDQIDIDMYLYEPNSGTITLQGASTPGGFRGPAKINDIVATWATNFLNNSASLQANGSVASPVGALATIASIPAASLPAGLYHVVVTVNIAGTTGAIDNNNTQLIGGAVSPIRLSNDIQISTFDLGNIQMNGSNALTLQSVAAGTVGAIYQGTIVATPIINAETVTLTIKERVLQLPASAGTFQVVGIRAMLLSERDKITLTTSPAVPCFLEVMGSADYRKIDRQES